MGLFKSFFESFRVNSGFLLGRSGSFGVSLGLRLVRFESFWLVLGSFGSFWVVLAPFGLLWLSLGLLLGCFSSLSVVWLFLDRFRSFLVV